MSHATLVIRPLEERPDAAAVLADWFVAEWPGYHRGRSLEDVAARFRLVPDEQQTLIAELDGEVVGTVSLRGPWEAAPDIPPPWIGELFVAAAHRGRGVGVALVEAAVAGAAAQGYDSAHIAIRVDPASYVRRGWEEVGKLVVGDESVTVLRIATAA